MNELLVRAERAGPYLLVGVLNVGARGAGAVVEVTCQIVAIELVRLN